MYRRGIVSAALAVVFSASAWAVTVVDQAGRTVRVPLPSRVASVFGVATAYVYALGGGDLLVGARYLGIPDSPLARGVMGRLDPEWEKKAFPGDATVETLVALRADLVLAGTRHLALVRLLEEVDMPAVVYAPETFDSVREAIGISGAILGREGEASRLVAFFDEVLAEVGRAVPASAAALRVLFVGTERLRVAAGGMYQARLIALAGGQSAADGLSGASWHNVSPEQILLWNPDVVVIAPYGSVVPQDYLADPVFSAIGAVRTGRVYKMPQLLFAWDTPIPESVLGVVWLAERLHPGRLAVTLRELATRFYREFYGIELATDELVGIIGP